MVEWACSSPAWLIIAGVVVAPLPGPGGVFFIVPGLALVLKTSMWAKRHYVRFKRWQPKAGRWPTGPWAPKRPSPGGDAEGGGAAERGGRQLTWRGPRLSART